ncbi:nuclear transport factor 2 family protein [Methylococcus sp. EFPC2]|uniref:nuclear transport factor 2 family protein n=1 Tax=Methylococcus sp. EFPC2 TaxID=2812648 RepID=UPI001967582F|nr:nuclear transport factor 2 family protein [Methylococcus sp. EFPC2]QSA99212.1 nuclear transport factor 2 family protein [Methylococcus sp. EFPC2]
MDIHTALFANEAFYLAFSQRDFPAMDRLWAQASPLLCIHPGWPALTEREAILASWHNILQNPATGYAVPHHAQVLAYGTLATVVCYEEIQGEIFVASNTFIEEDGEIRLIQHQAGPCAHPPQPESKAAPVMQ